MSDNRRKREMKGRRRPANQEFDLEYFPSPDFSEWEDAREDRMHNRGTVR